MKEIMQACGILLCEGQLDHKDKEMVMEFMVDMIARAKSYKAMTGNDWWSL